MAEKRLLVLAGVSQTVCSIGQIHHQHGNKPNLATYVQGQCWVSLAWVVKRKSKGNVALPLLSRLIPSASNTGKLVAS